MPPVNPPISPRPTEAKRERGTLRAPKIRQSGARSSGPSIPTTVPMAQNEKRPHSRDQLWHVDHRAGVLPSDAGGFPADPSEAVPEGACRLPGRA